MNATENKTTIQQEFCRLGLIPKNRQYAYGQAIWSVETRGTVAEISDGQESAKVDAVAFAAVLSDLDPESDNLFEEIWDAANETAAFTLLEWNNKQPITYLWICGVGCPGGMEFRQNTETEDDEEYCDFAEMDFLFDQLWDLEGTVDEHGRWCWNGEGEKPTDERGNTIYNVKAS